MMDEKEKIDMNMYLRKFDGLNLFQFFFDYIIITSQSFFTFLHPF